MGGRKTKKKRGLGKCVKVHDTLKMVFMKLSIVDNKFYANKNPGENSYSFQVVIIFQFSTKFIKTSP